MIAASPDGLLKDACVEIKCPTNAKAKLKYVKNGVISDKCKAQVQLQMYASGVKKCYFCVADWNFEQSKNVDIILVTYDSAYVKCLIEKIVVFWKLNIHPVLCRCTTVK
jgi:hypothetical protein